MDPRVTELHCITPMANIGSIVKHGILSYERAAKLAHDSIALQPVQDKRDRKQVPGGLKLHQYANLYFHARNPMMFKRKGAAASLCVLRVSTDVFKASGTVISDQNAASDYARFLDPSQWHLLNFDHIYAMDWTDPDLVTYFRKKSRKCAEVLVPHRVEPAWIAGAYVVDNAAEDLLVKHGFGLPVDVDPVLFFRKGKGDSHD